MTKAAELRIRRMLFWRFWIRKPVVALYEKIPPGEAGKTHEEICEYLSQTPKNLSVSIGPIDKYPVKTREKFLTSAGDFKVYPHFKMMISGKKDWVLDFINDQFVLEEKGANVARFVASLDEEPMTVYQPYTTRFDRVVNVAELPAVPLFKKFGHWIRLKKHSKLVERTQTEVAGFIEGLPPEKIQALKSIAVNTIATVLVDHSGSLKAYRNTEIAICVVYALLFLLDKLGVRYEVSAFTTRSWRGGNSRKLWIKNNRPENPGRLCDLLHIIYKSHDSDEKDHLKLILSNLLRPDLLKENVDGEAIEWAASRLAGRAEQKKILFHLSDGAPVDDSTLNDNHGFYLVDHLKSVVNALEEEGKIGLYGIGMHFKVREYFPHSINVVSASDAPRIVCKYVIEQLMTANH